ncbi:hypothetical protein NDU88_005598 [Pleurodeles waltl]|uniref:Uncharacterized protein n=1 Tax=Pleurodeles waltl TaxID=8319 RepID=A0AAV7WZ71_PLEWA|nr:hypothetical protein NDU88_005598 [Pleurodeles waltl]
MVMTSQQSALKSRQALKAIPMTDTLSRAFQRRQETLGGLIVNKRVRTAMTTPPMDPTPVGNKEQDTKQTTEVERILMFMCSISPMKLSYTICVELQECRPAINKYW